MRQVAAHVLHHVAKFHFQTNHNNSNNNNDAMLQLLLQLQLQAAVAPATCRARLGPVKGGKHVDDATFWHFKRLQRAEAARRKGGGRAGGSQFNQKVIQLGLAA